MSSLSPFAQMSRLLVLTFFISLISRNFASRQVDLDSVVQLTDDNFDDQIHNGFWIVKFVAPWCSHCQRLTPEYNTAATIASKNLSSIVQFGSIDVTENHKLRTSFGVFSFPTIKLFSQGQYVKDYTGPRSSSSLVQFAQSIASFTVTTHDWTSNILNSITSQLQDPSILPSSTLSSPISAFALRCAPNNCDDALSMFSTVALEFFDHSSFFHLRVNDNSTVSSAPSLIALSPVRESEVVSEVALSSKEALKDFIIQHQWPGVTALDFNRFNGIKQNAKLSKAFGLVALAADPNDQQLERYIHRVNKAAQNSQFESHFRFGWMDAVRTFRRGFTELGIDRFPRLVVFGSINPKAIWMSPEVNLTRLEDSLTGIINGQIQPMNSIDQKRKLLATIRSVFDDLYIFSSQSLWNLALVLGLTFTSATIFFCVCYFFILDLRTKDETDHTHEQLDDRSAIQTESTDEGTLRTFPESPRSTLRHREGIEQAEKQEFELEELEQKKTK